MPPRAGRLCTMAVKRACTPGSRSLYVECKCAYVTLRPGGVGKKANLREGAVALLLSRPAWMAILAPSRPDAGA